MGLALHFAPGRKYSPCLPRYQIGSGTEHWMGSGGHHSRGEEGCPDMPCYGQAPFGVRGPGGTGGKGFCGWQSHP